MSMLDSYTYQVDVNWTGGSASTVSAAGLPTLEVSPPPEFHGEPGRWTPEHLLTASAASCFLSTFLAVARFQKLEIQEFRMRAFARLEKLPGEGYRFTEITLVPEIRVAHDDMERTLRVIAKAEKGCFVTKSLLPKVQVEPKLIPAAAPELVSQS